jgi:hypothetical protein
VWGNLWGEAQARCREAVFALVRELARGLEPLTCCLQDSCATDCATPARRPFPLVGVPLATEDEARIRHPHPDVCALYVQSGCGTVHGFLSDGTDQVTIHVSGDRDARVTKQLAHYCDVSTRGQHQRRGTVSEAVEAQHKESRCARRFAD